MNADWLFGYNFNVGKKRRFLKTDFSVSPVKALTEDVILV